LLLGGNTLLRLEALRRPSFSSGGHQKLQQVRHVPPERTCPRYELPDRDVSGLVSVHILEYVLELRRGKRVVRCPAAQFLLPAAENVSELSGGQLACVVVVEVGKRGPEINLL
jgi:hypothetical protein